MVELSVTVHFFHMKSFEWSRTWNGKYFTCVWLSESSSPYSRHRRNYIKNGSCTKMLLIPWWLRTDDTFEEFSYRPQLRLKWMKSTSKVFQINEWNVFVILNGMRIASAGIFHSQQTFIQRRLFVSYSRSEGRKWKKKSYLHEESFWFVFNFGLNN